MTTASQSLITPVILSGGAGTRLWPLSRQGRSKQMLPLTDEATMLQLTARRVGDPALFAPPVVVAGAAQADAVEAQLGDQGLGMLILEPAMRDTAAAIALAALNAEREDLLLVLPSDHVIADGAGFVEAVGRAAALAREGWIVTFGMKAERPETGYGYIKRGEALGDGLFRAERFVEKPDAETAARYCADGGYDWNGGIFLFGAGTLIDALERHAPDTLAAARGAVEAQAREGRRVLPDAERFSAAPSISIDYAVMEKADRIAVAPVSVGWSDVGSWDALRDALETDEAGNAIAGDVLAIDSRDCLIRSDGPLVAAIGVSGLVIVATGDTILVVPRAQSQRVKEAVEALKARGRKDLL